MSLYTCMYQSCATIIVTMSASFTRFEQLLHTPLGDSQSCRTMSILFVDLSSCYNQLIWKINMDFFVSKHGSCATIFVLLVDVSSYLNKLFQTLNLVPIRSRWHQGCATFIKSILMTSASIAIRSFKRPTFLSVTANTNVRCHYIHNHCSHQLLQQSAPSHKRASSLWPQKQEMRHCSRLLCHLLCLAERRICYTLLLFSLQRRRKKSS